MPNRDGTGPMGQGAMQGGGARRQGQRGSTDLNWSGYCVCPKCGQKTAHSRGTPCALVKCPKCGALMLRGS